MHPQIVLHLISYKSRSILPFMRTNPLLPLLRSQTQGLMLAELYLHPDREFSLTDLASRTGSNVKTMHTEANRLTEAGFIKGHKVGNVRMLSADTTHRLAGPLGGLMIATYGPEPVLAELLGGQPNVRDAFIFGSWAARSAGIAGGIPQDIDVVVVGRPDRDQIFEIAEMAQKKLGVEVNIRVVRPERWDNPDGDHFTLHVQDSPLVRLNITEEKAA